MNIINRLTLRHIKHNKKRTIITIFGVIISTAMLTAVTVAIPSMKKMVVDSTIKEEGGWFYSFRDVPADKLTLVKEDPSVTSIAVTAEPVLVKSDILQTKEIPYIQIEPQDSKAMLYQRPELLEGRYPKNNSELLISRYMNTMCGTKLKPGDTITVDVGKNAYEEKAANESGEEEDNGETTFSEPSIKFQKTGSKTYTIAGIAGRINNYDGYSECFSAISGLAKEEQTACGNLTIYVTSANTGEQIYADAKRLAGMLGLTDENIDYHRSLLRFIGTSQNGTLMQTLYHFAAIMYIIIIIGSVSLIYNAFAISLTERSRYLGMLASVGATRLQKRQSVFFEGFIIGIIGIPLGVGSGLLGMAITFYCVGPALASLTSYASELRLYVTPASIFISACLAALTIFISACIPAFKASRLSPIDAIRKKEGEKLTRRRVKISRLTQKLFGFPGAVAMKNMKRNRRRYRATILSLVISIILFLSVSAFTGLATRSYAYLQADDTAPNYDAYVMLGGKEDDENFPLVKRELSQFKYVDKLTISGYYGNLFLIADKYMDSRMPENRDDLQGYHDVSVNIQSLDDSSLKELADKCGADYEALKDAKKPSAIVAKYCLYTSESEEHKRTLIPATSVKKGQTLPLQPYEETDDDTNSSGIVKKGKEFPFTIAAFTEEYPLGGALPSGDNRLDLYVSEDTFRALPFKDMADYSYNTFYMTATDGDKLVEELEQFERNYSIRFNSIIEERKMGERMILIVNVFSYGFITLITLICIANILNTTATSIALREREFAMLKSVGMSEGQFKKMIRFESLFYGVKALLYGLPVSIAIIVFMHHALRSSIEQPFYFPVVPMIIVIIALFLIVSVSMTYATSRLKGKSLVETLREEN